MKKQLPIAGIANELSGASAFFPMQGSRPKQQRQPTHKRPIETSQIVQHVPQATPKTENVVQSADAKQAQEQPDTHSDSPQPQAVVASSNRATMPPRHHDTMTPSMIEPIRKVVKQVGKEAATHRFTEEEKRKLADIVYTYERQGYRTSENEITRIAVNWLMLDYDEHGANSVLARLLESLHR